MTGTAEAHTCTTHDPDCFRCDLSRDESGRTCELPLALRSGQKPVAHPQAEGLTGLLGVSNEVYDPRNHDLTAVWNQQPLAPRHAQHPASHRTICGIDTRTGKWETWQSDWHGFVDAAGTACRRCVKATQP